MQVISGPTVTREEFDGLSARVGAIDKVFNKAITADGDELK